MGHSHYPSSLALHPVNPHPVPFGHFSHQPPHLGQFVGLFFFAQDLDEGGEGGLHDCGFGGWGA